MDSSHRFTFHNIVHMCLTYIYKKLQAHLPTGFIPKSPEPQQHNSLCLQGKHLIKRVSTRDYHQNFLFKEVGTL